MMEECAIAGQIRTLEGRRVLDTAEGVLIGLRRCDTDAAFQELVDAAQTRGVPVFTIASALVDLAAGGERSTDLPADARVAAIQQWGPLLNND
jgi:ANTAR domain